MGISSKDLLRRLTPVSRTKAWLSSAPDGGKRAQYAGFHRLRLTFPRPPLSRRRADTGCAGNLCPSGRTIDPKPCDLRVGSARAGSPRRATRATDRSRSSCPRADNAAECQPDCARMLPSELPTPACAGVPQAQCGRGLGETAVSASHPPIAAKEDRRLRLGGRGQTEP